MWTRLLASLVGLTLASFVLIGCGSTTGTPGPLPTPPPGAVVVSAGDLSFDQTSVAAPSGVAFTIWFLNRVNVPHNLRIADSSDTTVVATEIFGGPAARLVEVPALAAGAYTLICDVHPGMTAELSAN